MLDADWLRVSQWISEVLHFCQGLPIILVGCKKDLRYDQKTIEELHKTSQKPVTPEQVRRRPSIS
jgi:GTPase SAR1 family protein